MRHSLRLFAYLPNEFKPEMFSEWASYAIEHYRFWQMESQIS